MSLQDRIINHFSDSIQSHQDAMIGLCELIEYAAQRLVSTLLQDNKILTCGNGRSWANVQLFTSALRGQFECARPALPIILLGADTINFSINNEYLAENIFAKPLRALAQQGDILVIYSDGYESIALNKTIEAAHDSNISIIALTGAAGGGISVLLHETDIEIRVPANNSLRIHEVQVLITHCLCDLIDQQLFGV
jgi:D-sedoheptulose 7-phosphate isomerase